jgi:hypothetical protein
MGLEQEGEIPPHSADILIGWQTAETMMRRLGFLGGPPECADKHKIDLIMGCHSFVGASRSRT